MTRSTNAAATAAFCAILLVTVQIDLSAQTKTPPKAPVKAAAPAKAAPAKAVTAKVAAAPVVPGETLTGCLEADGAKYKLTDLQGTQAPKGRSWKTGFITKKTKDVEVVGTSSSLKLKDHVGHKISVVGVKDGETHFKARSIKQLAGSCS
jgi:hypothetical protein